MRRNYDRMKVQNSRMEGENAEFRAANSQNRTDLSRVETVLEEVLGLDLPEGIYESLSQVSELLSLVKGRLR